MNIKHFVDIDAIREQDIQVAEGIIRKHNTNGFAVGDIISITEKIDGANASIQYNPETNQLEAFSRAHKLTYNNTLEGFWNYVQTLNPNDYRDATGLVIFGEWLLHNKIKYDADKANKWYIYSIYDLGAGEWWKPANVKEFAATHNLTYIHELYYGIFISWDHCRTFLNSPAYGSQQEGIVIRNITNFPRLLKIVNESFKETKVVKETDPEKESKKQHAMELIQSIVTRARVEKVLSKMQHEDIIPATITNADMATVARNIPKAIYADCIKEEPEIMQAAGEYGGKYCASVALFIVKQIIAGE